MAHFGKDLDDFKGSRCIHIRSSEQTENFTLYIITVTVGPYSWTVKHRYSEFYQLHEKLAASYKLDRSLLPPKKMFGNQTESFIKKRQRELEIYLRTVILYLVHHMPSCMAYFLDFDKYEIHGITQVMAEDLYCRGESLLLSREKYEVSALQLYSLTERLKLPEPTCESGDVKKDLGHILDFITRTKHLKVLCSRKPVGTSNILMGKLSFDLTLFKSLQTLEICGCNFRMVDGLEVIKQTVVKFKVHESTSSMKEIVLQDASHWRAEDGSIIVGCWNLVTELDFSHNSFMEIHESIQLMPNIKKLNLSHNMIESILNIHWLSQLTHIDLSHNNIHHVDSLHTKLGNIKCLRLAHNKLESLHGFAKLFSLETLDISYNKIVPIEELRHVCQLPCLEELSLEGSPVTSSLDYRTRIFEMFGDRISEVVLDKKPADQKELGTVAVLQALRKAKDLKMVKKALPKKSASAVSLSDVYSQSYSSSMSDHQDERKSVTTFPSAHELRSSTMIPSVTDWHRRERAGNNHSPCSFSQDSLSSCYSGGERDDHADGITTISSAERTAASFHADEVYSQFGSNHNNSSSNNDKTDQDIVRASLHEVVPEAHPFDLTIDNSSTCSPTAHKQVTSLTGRNSGDGRTLMCSAVDLPTTTNPAFLLWLNKHLFTSGDISRDTESSKTGRESIIDILWCYMEQLSKPSVLYPCCAVLTKKHFFIEKLLGLESSFPGVPELNSCSMISIQNIQQLVLGPCHAFLRLEEAFVGKSGVFTLFSLEPHGLKQFFTKLFNACCDFDIINSYSFVDLTVKSDLLKTITLREEHSFVISSDRLVSAALVQMKNSKIFNFLVLSENKVYCLDLDCTHWPPASFETTPDTSISFNVLHEFCIMDKICNIKISPADERVSFNENSKLEMNVLDSRLDMQFIQFELSLEVALSLNSSVGLSERVSETSQRHAGVSYYFPSAACRDIFLDRLSNMRTELAHRMSPNVREEPEGGNEQVSPSNCYAVKSWSNPSSKIISSSYSCNPLFTAGQTTPKGSSSFTTSQTSSIGASLRRERISPRGAPSFTLEQSNSREGFSLITEQSNLSMGPSFTIGQSIPRGVLPFTTGQSSPVWGSSIITEQAIPTFKDTTNEAQSRNLQKSSQVSPNIKHSFEEELVPSESSAQAISVAKSDIYHERKSHQNISSSFSSSPRDDLSISPMSNFSRASISPAAELQIERKGKKHYTSTSTHQRKMVAAKADSLPSSFDWKQYYFKSLPIQDARSTTGCVASKPKNISVSSSDSSWSRHFEIHNLSSDTYLEDIDSSSEFENGFHLETEHELYLKNCIKSYNLINPLSTKLKPLSLMNGRELIKFFHSVISQKLYIDNQDMLSEELHHVLWTMVVPYTNPKHEITTLVMLSTHGIYLVSDTNPKMVHKSRPSWMTHSRNRSDSAITVKPGTSTSNCKLVEPYFIFRYKDLLQVNIGLFDQCVRLTGGNENSVFTIATRDSVVTETLVQKLKHVLSFVAISPVIEKSRTETEMDFYKPNLQNVKSTMDGIVYTHPSKVKFIYPGDDAVRDILYLVNECSSQGKKIFTSTEDITKLWFYLQCYLLPLDDGRTPDRNQPVSVVITTTHFCLAEEDIVTYPLPDFVRGVPENPCHEIVECRRIDNLKRITLFHGHPHNMILTFLDDSQDIVVDVSMQHFGQIKERQQLCPEITYRLFVQSIKERDKMVQILDTLWKGLVSQVGRIMDINKM